MTVTVFGGSAPGTPALLAFLAGRPAAEKMHLRLVGRSPQRLEAVGRAARILTRNSSIEVEALLADLDPHRLFSGADAVLIQARFGGLRGRIFDESFPVQYGLCGDEGLGAGGLSAAWRSWPPLEDLLASITRYAPEAFVILLTSPAGILTRLACLRFPALRIAGICELPWTTLCDVSRTVGVPLKSVHYSYTGVNHLGWFHRITTATRDLVEEYAARQVSEAHFPSGKLIRAYGAIPLKYLRLHYEPEEVLAEQRSARPRGLVLAEIAERAADTFLRGSHDEILSILPIRPTPWYQHAVGPLLIGLANGDAGIPFFLSVPDSAGDIWEIPHEFRSGRLEAAGKSADPPTPISEILREFVEYERLAAHAVLERDPQSVAGALERHPWIRRRHLPTDEIAQEIMTSL